MNRATAAPEEWAARVMAAVMELDPREPRQDSDIYLTNVLLKMRRMPATVSVLWAYDEDNPGWTKCTICCRRWATWNGWENIRAAHEALHKQQVRFILFPPIEPSWEYADDGP